MAEPYRLYGVRLRRVAWQEVRFYPRMTDKPPRPDASHFVNAEAIQDDEDLPGQVWSNYVHQEVDKLSGSLPVVDTVDERTGLDVQCAE